MRNERITADYIRDRRAGIAWDFSVPSEPVYLIPDRGWGREGESLPEGADITT
ncbi:hypothetical protein [Phyllobacterium phragmitis]|uniref:Uncharacterized protein n=1 Tax=Phyllobacterium phragmitis TaxID=2670329 RepID=A0ABQ0GZ06_9HYPH